MVTVFAKRMAFLLRGIAASVATVSLLAFPLSQAAAAPAKKTAATTSHTAHVKGKVKVAVRTKDAKTKSHATTRAATKRRVAKTRQVVEKERVNTHHAARLRHRATVARSRRAVAAGPVLVSFGHQEGLERDVGPLDITSSAALVIDQDTHEVLVNKNDQAVLPIASLTKLMTGLILSSAKLPMDTPITITEADVDNLKHSASRLAVGTTLTRGELMHLALMSSENRAAHALARTFPGGLQHFVDLMNARARSIGMTETHYVEPTGLSNENRSSARDLAMLVQVAYKDPLLRELTTSHGFDVTARGGRMLEYHNTNPLIRDSDWDIGLQKTGYIWESGRCMVLQTTISGRHLIMVFLDAGSTQERTVDAERVRTWIERQATVARARAARHPLT